MNAQSTLDTPSRRKLIIIFLALGLLIVVCRWGWSWWQGSRFVESTDDAYVEADMSLVSPRVAGAVKQVLVADNQRVQVGDVLFVLDDRDFKERVAHAAALVNSRRASIISLNKQIKLQQAVIDQAIARVAAANVERRRASLNRIRFSELVAKGLVSRQLFETADADAQKAEADYSQMQAAATTERQRVDVFVAARSQAEGDLEQAESAWRLATLELDDTIVKSPIAGLIGNRTVRAGQYLKAGSAVLAIVPISDAYVIANFKETQFERMRAGQTAKVSVDAFDGHALNGIVDSVAPASGSRFALLPPENATGNFRKIVQRFPVRIRLVGPAQETPALANKPAIPILAGMSVVVSVDTRR